VRMKGTSRFELLMQHLRYYADLLRALLKMNQPFDDEMGDEAKKDLERRWMHHFPGLKPLGETVTYSVAQYICAIKLQRAFRSYLVGSTIESKRKRGQKREERM
jgi:hypothetical protein